MNAPGMCKTNSLDLYDDNSLISSALLWKFNKTHRYLVSIQCVSILCVGADWFQTNNRKESACNLLSLKDEKPLCE